MGQTEAFIDRAHSAPLAYYIDESGNTGDLTKAGGETYGFEQRMFTLAAVGCELDDAFMERFNVLRTAHRMQSPEVKSRQAYEDLRKPKKIQENLRKSEENLKNI